MTEPGAPTEFGAADRRALWSVAVQFFVNGAVFASFIPRLPEIRERIGVSLDTLGFLITIALVVGLLGSVAASPLIERFGTRAVLVGGAFVLVASVPLIGVATVPLVFVLGYGLMAFFDVVVDIAMNLQGSWLSARRHMPVMNRLHGLWSFGTVIGGLVAARLAAAGVSLAAHLTAVAVILLASVVFVARGLLRTDEHRAVPPAETRPARDRSMRLGLVLLAVSGGLAVTVEIVSSDWAAFRLSEDLGATAGFAGLGYVAFTVGMTVGRLGGDFVQSLIGNEPMFRLAIIVSTLGLAGAGFAPNRWIVLAGYTIAGVGIATFFPKLYDDAAQLPGRRGAGLGWMSAGSRITGLVVPTVVGVLAASRLSVGTATALVTLPCAAGFLAIAVARRHSDLAGAGRVRAG
ncbi:MAG: MFS transporter [Ilumatobacter sp.]|nr:MFS transporter [Ilumatobacter sp.]